MSIRSSMSSNLRISCLQMLLPSGTGMPKSQWKHRIAMPAILRMTAQSPRDGRATRRQ